MAEQYNRAFKGVWISKDIWLAKDLGWTEKLVLVEIDSLDGEQGCWASNDYLAAFFGLSKGRISKVISALKDKGYITVEMLYKPGTKEIQKRTIRVDREVWSKTSIPPSRKQPEGMVENVYTPIVENSQENNTSINNTSNNTNKDKDRQSSVNQLSDPNFLEIKQLYESNVRVATFRDCQAIDEAMEVYEPALILEAIKAGASSARSFKYILGILDNWRLEFNVKTYADWQQKIQSKGGQPHGDNQRPNASHIGKTPEEIAMLERLRTYSSNPIK